jgi:hypothetical protein
MPQISHKINVLVADQHPVEYHRPGHADRIWPEARQAELFRTVCLTSAARSSLTCRSSAGSSGKLSRVFNIAILYRIARQMGIHKRPYCLIFASGYPVFRGRQVCCAIRQSLPSSSIASCAEVRLILPSFAAGQTNGPRSNRLLNRHAPCESHQMILSKSPRRPRNTNR